MNIALAILHADPARGGAERYTLDLAASLCLRGHRVSILAGTFAASGPWEAVTLKTGGATRARRYLSFLNSLADVAASTGSLVHAMLPVRACHLYHPHAGIAAEAVAAGHLKHRGPMRLLAAAANRLNRRRNLFAKVERQLLAGQRPPIVLTLSDYITATLQRHYPAFPTDRLRKLFNGVDVKRFSPSHPPAELPAGTRALFVAQDFGRKGLAQAIATTARCPGVQLIVIGRDNAGPYRRQAAELGIAGRVHFMGGQADVRPFYAACDFLVLPTRHDPCSLVVLEALAMGKPVISTIHNGACEIMADGVHGFVLHDAEDAAALAEAMKRLCDAAAREQMWAACLALRGPLSWETHVDRLEAIYREIRP